MPENVGAWWARRQRSKAAAVPYAIGTYRDDWERYPTLVRQYHPDLNENITLTQIPPAADVYLTWQCNAGHLFVATPEEQRNRPGRVRRQSSWCPECSALAVPRRVAAAGPALGPVAVVPTKTACPVGHGVHPPGRGCPVCFHARAGADRVAVGDAFVSSWAPKPASAAEGRLRQLLAGQLELDLTANAVKVARPFFNHIEVWPDIVLTDLRVAIEYDTIGKFGLEHVGKREATDRRKDRLLRAAGWEVVRVRCGKLQPLGPHDLRASGVTATLIENLLDTFRAIRGDLIVNAYLRGDAA